MSSLRKKHFYFSAFYLTALLLVFLTSNVWAQKFNLGIKLLGSFNNTYGQGTSTYLPTPIYGGSAGIYGTFKPFDGIKFDKFKIRVEALVSSRGFNSQYNSVGSSSPSLYSGYQPSLAPSNTVNTGPGGSYLATLTKQTLYLDIPIGLDYELVRGANLQVGGMVSIFMNQWNSSLSNTSTINTQQPTDTKYYQQYQFYVYGGAYYQFNFGLTAGARANLGLTNTFLQVNSGTGNQLYPYALQVFVTYPIFKF